jgi:TonB family protein
MEKIYPLLLFTVFSLAFSQLFAQEKSKAILSAPDTSNIFICQFPENPQFPGGEEAMFKYLKERIPYPESKENPEGLAVISFLVTKTGEIKEILILKSTEPAFDSAVVKAVNEMPKWIPGKQNGKIQDMRFTMPIRFGLYSSGSIKEKRKK